MLKETFGVVMEFSASSDAERPVGLLGDIARHWRVDGCMADDVAGGGGVRGH